MRALNIFFGLVGPVGGLFTGFVAVPALAGIVPHTAGGVAILVGVPVAGLVSEFVGVQTLLTGLLGSPGPGGERVDLIAWRALPRVTVARGLLQHQSTAFSKTAITDSSSMMILSPNSLGIASSISKAKK
jgi:hypothetical protein